MYIKYLKVKFDEKAFVFYPKKDGKLVQVIGINEFNYLQYHDMVVVCDKNHTPIIVFEIDSDALEFCEINKDFGFLHYRLYKNSKGKYEEE